MLPGTNEERAKMYAEFDMHVSGFVAAMHDKDPLLAPTIISELCGYLYESNEAILPQVDQKIVAFVTFILALHAETLIGLLEACGIDVSDYLFERQLRANAVSVDPSFVKGMEAGDEVNVKEE